MPWLLVDLLLVALGLVALAVAGLRLWRGVKALGKDVAAAGEAVGGATEELSRLQAELDSRRPQAHPGTVTDADSRTSSGSATRPDTRPSPARRR